MHPTHDHTQPTSDEPATDKVAGPSELPSSVLRRAALYLERHGWTWGITYELPHPDAHFPAADVVGAIRIAVTGHPDRLQWPHQPAAHDYTDDQAVDVGRTLDVLAAYLELRHHETAVEALVWWNDTVPTNTPEVVTVLRRAADWHAQQSHAYAVSFVDHLLGSADGR